MLLVSKYVGNRGSLYQYVLLASEYVGNRGSLHDALIMRESVLTYYTSCSFWRQ